MYVGLMQNKLQCVLKMFLKILLLNGICRQEEKDRTSSDEQSRWLTFVQKEVEAVDAATACENLLAAAVGNHVLMQGRVPVIVAFHATTLPLVIERRKTVTLLRDILHLHVQDEKRHWYKEQFYTLEKWIIWKC